jgi:hypothetical protein
MTAWVLSICMSDLAFHCIAQALVFSADQNAL